jgi:hypothetical protein
MKIDASRTAKLAAARLARRRFDWPVRGSAWAAYTPNNPARRFAQGDGWPVDQPNNCLGGPVKWVASF